MPFYERKVALMLHRFMRRIDRIGYIYYTKLARFALENMKKHVNDENNGKWVRWFKLHTYAMKKRVKLQ